MSVVYRSGSDATRSTVIWIVVAMAAVILGAIRYSHSLSYVHTASVAYGWVIDFDMSSGSGHGGGFAPIVRYTPQSGGAVTFISDLHRSSTTEHLGQRVRVIYQSADPSNADIESIPTIWSGTDAFCFIALVCLMLGLLTIISSISGSKTSAVTGMLIFSLFIISIGRLIELGSGNTVFFYFFDGFVLLIALASLQGGLRPETLKNPTNVDPGDFIKVGVAGLAVALLCLIPGPWEWFLKLVNPLP